MDAAMTYTITLQDTPAEITERAQRETKVLVMAAHISPSSDRLIRK